MEVVLNHSHTFEVGAVISMFTKGALHIALQHWQAVEVGTVVDNIQLGEIPLERLYLDAIDLVLHHIEDAPVKIWISIPNVMHHTIGTESGHSFIIVDCMETLHQVHVGCLVLF